MYIHDKPTTETQTTAEGTGFSSIATLPISSPESTQSACDSGPEGHSPDEFQSNSTRSCHEALKMGTRWEEKLETMCECGQEKPNICANFAFSIFLVWAQEKIAFWSRKLYNSDKAVDYKETGKIALMMANAIPVKTREINPCLLALRAAYLYDEKEPSQSISFEMSSVSWNRGRKCAFVHMNPQTHTCAHAHTHTHIYLVKHGSLREHHEKVVQEKSPASDQTLSLTWC